MEKMTDREVVTIVKTAIDRGLGWREAEQMVKQAVAVEFFKDEEFGPMISKELDRRSGDTTKAAMAAVMNPAGLAQALDTAVHESRTAVGDMLRVNHPVHQDLTDKFAMWVNGEQIKSAAHRNGIPEQVEPGVFDQFARLPLADKIALMSGVGALGGAGYAYMAGPDEEDYMHRRGTPKRLARAAARAGITAGGAMLGGNVGGTLLAQLSPQGTAGTSGIGVVGGALAGGYGGNRLADALLG